MLENAIFKAPLIYALNPSGSAKTATTTPSIPLTLMLVALLRDSAIALSKRAFVHMEIPASICMLILRPVKELLSRIMFSHPTMPGNQMVGGSSFPGVAVRESMGMSWGNLPPSLKPPPEGGYPPLPIVDWG
ncbi:hypothetical protein OIU76_016985 [Salix suchowensis]|nr:hypothetical protein OIU76_016985 [Salix suchowensis]